MYLTEYLTIYALFKMETIMFLKMKNLFEKFELLQLVSEPWFEGFGCTLGGNWTQTEDLRKLFK